MPATAMVLPSADMLADSHELEAPIGASAQVVPPLEDSLATALATTSILLPSLDMAEDIQLPLGSEVLVQPMIFWHVPCAGSLVAEVGGKTNHAATWEERC